MQITKKQHYAPSFYFKRFSDNSQMIQVIDLPEGRIMKSRSYTSVCWADFYYAEKTGVSDEVSQEFETFFKEIEDYFSIDFDSILETILNYKEISPEQLDKMAWFFSCLWVRSPQMRSQLNKMTEDVMKWYAGIIASEPNFIDNAKNKLTQKGVSFTEADLDNIQDMYQNGDLSMTISNQDHLRMIMKCEEYMHWFKAKNWRFYIAKGSKRFITSDTPVIEIFKGDTLQEQMYNNHIMQRPQFLALTPDVLIELTDPTIGKKFKRKAVNNKEVDEHNLLRAQYSERYAYSKSKTDLQDLMQYYLN